MNVNVSKDMIIGDVLDLDPNVGQILLESGLHCLGCIAASGETIEEACSVHNLDCDKLIEDLNTYFNQTK